MTRYYVAIDGGGTKTDMVFFDDAGRIIRRVVGPSSNPNALSDADLYSRFYDLFMGLWANEHPQELACCFAGMSGGDHPGLKKRLKRTIEETISTRCDAIIIENDAINALWSGTNGAPGIVVIAGTGSIAYGRVSGGDHFRIGGWGHLVGDDGSGYYIGREAVRAALRMHDGLGTETKLAGAIKSHFDIPHLPDVIPIVYGGSKSVLASLVPVVDKTAQHGDTVAKTIMANAARYLAELIQAGIARFQQIQVSETDTAVILVGGLWQSSLIRKKIAESVDHPLIFPDAPPVYGAMIGALQGYGDAFVKERLKQALQASAAGTPTENAE